MYCNGIIVRREPDKIQKPVSTHPPYTLEDGDFTVYRLWELKDLI